MWVEHVSGGSGMLLSMEYKACVFSLDSIQVVWDCNNAGCDTAGTVIEENKEVLAEFFQHFLKLRLPALCPWDLQGPKCCYFINDVVLQCV